MTTRGMSLAAVAAMSFSPVVPVPASHDHPQPMQAVAMFVLRLGLAFVFVRFGVQKIVDWHGWAILVPAAFTEALTDATGFGDVELLRMLGYVEVLVGVHVALGLWTRAAAAVAAIVLLGAVAMMGTSGIGTRDVGLLGAAIAIAAQGADRYSLDARLQQVRTLRAREESCPCS